MFARTLVLFFSFWHLEFKFLFLTCNGQGFIDFKFPCYNFELGMLNERIYSGNCSLVFVFLELGILSKFVLEFLALLAFVS